jgi:hypothetical protein
LCGFYFLEITGSAVLFGFFILEIAGSAVLVGFFILEIAGSGGLGGSFLCEINFLGCDGSGVGNFFFDADSLAEGCDEREEGDLVHNF